MLHSSDRVRAVDKGATSSIEINPSQSSRPGSDRFEERFDAARAGSTAALGELLESCRNYLLMIANHAVEPEWQAKVGASDLVQETFAEVQRVFDRFDGETEGDLLRWMTRILEYKIGNTLQHYRSAARRDVRRELDWHRLCGSAFLQKLPDANGELPSAVLRSKEYSERVQAALGALSEDQRLVIRLRVDENLTFDEIAQRMQRSAEAARKLFARAIHSLQTLLDPRHA
ncbi:MAG: sigma-70 family RNA polymerase sigma factor [Planctomycetaceae bacterium]